jgi:hypothetical protein
MMDNITAHKIPLWVIVLLSLVGLVSCFVPLLVAGVWALVIIGTVVAAIYKKNEWVWYGIAASPILEVWSRMVKGAPVLDEIGKYYLLLAIILVFIHHVKEETHKPVFKIGFVLIALLLPSLFVNIPGFDREQWVFNILPTLELSLLLMLVARERWHIERFAKTIQVGVLPIIFIVIYLLVKTPAISDVNFALGANFKAAGGGTNQVATVLGLGIVYIMLSLLLKRPVSARMLCYALIAFLFFRSFLTFSRGGVFSSVASILIAVAFAMIVNRKTFYRYMLVLLVFVVAGLVSFNAVDKITGNKLSQRYQGETAATLSGEQAKTWRKITSGRSTLIMADWIIFKEYPLFGVGPGGAKEFRNNLGAPQDSAAHTEFTRLMSEHGLGGLLAAIVMCLFPFYWVNKQKYHLWKGISAALFCMAILTAAHSAMRTNTTIVCYTLAAVPVFIRAGNKDEN